MQSVCVTFNFSKLWKDQLMILPKGQRSDDLYSALCAPDNLVFNFSYFERQLVYYSSALVAFQALSVTNMAKNHCVTDQDSKTRSEGPSVLP